MTKIFWKTKEYKAMADWIDANPQVQGLSPLEMMRAAVVAALPVDRQRHMATVVMATNEMGNVEMFRIPKASVMPVVQLAPKDPLEFTISEFDNIKHLLNPNVRIRVLT